MSGSHARGQTQWHHGQVGVEMQNVQDHKKQFVIVASLRSLEWPCRSGRQSTIPLTLWNQWLVFTHRTSSHTGIEEMWKWRIWGDATPTRCHPVWMIHVAWEAWQDSSHGLSKHLQWYSHTISCVNKLRNSADIYIYVALPSISWFSSIDRYFTANWRACPARCSEQCY